MKPLRDLDRTVGLPLLRLATEGAVLFPWSGPHRLARRFLADRLRKIETLLDRDFYLRQLRPEWSRPAAERDPALHYHLVGRFHNCAPHPDFEPIAYRDSHPHLTWADDPLVDFAQRYGRFRQSERVATPPSAAGTVVTLHHARGGGSSHYLELLEKRLRGQGHRVVRLARLTVNAALFRAADPESGTPLGPVFDLLAEPQALADVLDDFRAGRLVVNHAVDLPIEALVAISSSCRRAGVSYEVHVHDYYYLCPRINLVDVDGRYCGAPVQTNCRGCRLEQPGRLAITRAAWREATRGFLAAAAAVVGPSRDVAARYAQVWPDLHIEVRHPEDDADVAPPEPRDATGPAPLTVAILGRLNVPKGFEVVLALAKRIQHRTAPVRLVLIGQSIGDKALRRHGVVVHGRYRAEDATTLLELYAPHLMFIPSIWPETWSFVLSQALRSRLPVCAFRIGAVAERLAGLGFGTLLPYDLAVQPDRLLDALIATARTAGQEEPPKPARALAHG